MALVSSPDEFQLISFQELVGMMQVPLCEREWIIQQHEEFSPDFSPFRWTIIEWKTGDGFADAMKYAHQVQEELYRSMAVPAELMNPSPPGYGVSPLRKSFRTLYMLQMWRKIRGQ